jgi:hypothetical protein
MRELLVLLLFVHAVAHAPSFVVGAWQLRALPQLPYRTTLLAGSIDLGEVGIRIIGVAWLLVALSFTASGVGLALSLAWWQHTAYVAIAFSVVVCILGWPDSRLGLVANAVLAAILFAGTRFGRRSGGAP